jgi:hypothetical protein
MVAVAVGLASAVVGAGASVYSSNKAASAQSKAANQASQLQKDQYAQTRADLAPYRDTGANALSQYQGLLGMKGKDAQSAAMSQYTESPFLGQLVNRTTSAVEASRAARGGLFSGGAAQEIGDRAGQLYLGDYNNYLSRVGGLADTGLNASTQTGNFGANAAAGQAQSAMAAGNAKAGGYINTANSVNNALSQGASLYGAYQGGAFGTGGNNPYLNGRSASGDAYNILTGGR